MAGDEGRSGYVGSLTTGIATPVNETPPTGGVFVSIRGAGIEFVSIATAAIRAAAPRGA
ncbi:hypothetical protein AZ78_4803 [Lysobacter capsici AZ78]|uniref:Uncharacterized protein n=1 Tax=Lysobacter capsici AZ78 TaxID=1444315 RepID=A0A108UDP9_9GAMM|nr:hypothetical protein AZ78_4803 [Lysobacter capsici AZ78]